MNRPNADDSNCYQRDYAAQTKRQGNSSQRDWSSRHLSGVTHESMIERLLTSGEKRQYELAKIQCNPDPG